MAIKKYHIAYLRHAALPHHLTKYTPRGGLTVVANLATDDGLTALLMNAGASAQTTKLPLHVLRVTPDNSLVRR